MTSLLVLLVCVVASFRADEVRPARIVTETVSVAFMPPRGPTSPVAPTERMDLAASGAPESRSLALAPERADVPPPRKNPRAPLAGLRGARGAPSGKPRSPAAQVARGAAAAPRQQANSAACLPRAGQLRLVRADGSDPPRVPALFLPLRRLGLAIQAKLAGPCTRQHAAGGVGPARSPQKPACLPVAAGLSVPAHAARAG
ncbi:MAG: hypothetical protein ACXWC6_05010 [Ramlibacter sp.]